MAFHLIPGQTADIAAAPDLLLLAPPMIALIADKAYDGACLRCDFANRKNRRPFDADVYGDPNVIECMFCRLKDFRRIATRYDKLAQNFLSAICLAAIIAYWL